MQLIHIVTIKENYDRVTIKDLRGVFDEVKSKIKDEYKENYGSGTFDKLRSKMNKNLEEAIAHSISNFDVFIKDCTKWMEDFQTSHSSGLLVQELSRIVNEASNFKKIIIQESSGLDDDSKIKIFCNQVLKTLSHFEPFNKSFVNRLAVLAGNISTQPSFDMIGTTSKPKSKRENKQQNEPVIIKHITLIKSEYALSINHGDVYIPFTSKKSEHGLVKEKKQFKALVHFWDFRWEKNREGKVLFTGDIVTRDNLQTSTHAPTERAALNYIARLNSTFEIYNVPITIEGKNKKYKLIIIKG